MNNERESRTNRNHVKPQLDNILNELKRQAESAVSGEISSPPGFGDTNAVTFEEKLQSEKSRRQQIENDNKVKDQQLKESTLKKLFIFLGAETVVIFALAFLQGFGTFWRWKFHLDDWSFRLVITATIGQITTMLIIAVQHLFPKKK